MDPAALRLLRDSLRSGDLPRQLAQAAEGLCRELGAERLTVYECDAGARTLTALVQHGMHGFGTLRIPLSDASLAGYAAIHRRALNVANVRDAAELARIDPPARWFPKVDERSGFTTRQALTAPVLRGERALGVVQLLNATGGGRFSEECERELGLLCQALSEAIPDWRARATGHESHAKEMRRRHRIELEEQKRAEHVARERAAGLVREELMAQAAGALHESASGPGARARERLLLLYCARYRAGVFTGEKLSPWREDEIDDLEWMHRLAQSGHVFARRLVARILDGGFGRAADAATVIAEFRREKAKGSDTAPTP